MKVQVATILILSGLISSCASEGVTPEKSNIFQAGRNLSNGEFDRQLGRKELNLANSENELAQEQRRNTSLRSTLAQDKAELRRLRLELANVEKENLSIETRISKIKTNTAQQKRKKANVLSRLNKIKKKTRTTKSLDGSSGQYKIQIRQLQHEVKALREMLIND